MERQEIAEQLIALAQTPEQIQYLTSNDTTILTDRIEQMKDEYFRTQKQIGLDNRYRQGKEDAYRSIIVELFNTQNRSHCNYD